MKSDFITVNNRGEGMDEALEMVAQVSARCGLTDKETLYVRLITEEMMGLVRSIGGEVTSTFGIECFLKQFTFHLNTEMYMDADKREMLISSATNHKNEAAHGFIGKLRNVIEGALLQTVPYAGDGYLFTYDPALFDVNLHPDAEWDRYEQSILNHAADTVKVGVRGDRVELTVSKKF